MDTIQTSTLYIEAMILSNNLHQKKTDHRRNQKFASFFRTNMAPPADLVKIGKDVFEILKQQLIEPKKMMKNKGKGVLDRDVAKRFGGVQVVGFVKNDQVKAS